MDLNYAQMQRLAVLHIHALPEGSGPVCDENADEIMETVISNAGQSHPESGT
ncbi:MAG: hypothetical protein Q4G25_07690 [Paracoccus sp. (in: a-proteobacteria)]|nr:hypothetical protein [Paracoccus sp. (in: a-proteobacteria)]